MDRAMAVTFADDPNDCSAASPPPVPLPTKNENAPCDVVDSLLVPSAGDVAVDADVETGAPPPPPAEEAAPGAAEPPTAAAVASAAVDVVDELSGDGCGLTDDPSRLADSTGGSTKLLVARSVGVASGGAAVKVLPRRSLPWTGTPTTSGRFLSRWLASNVIAGRGGCAGGVAVPPTALAAGVLDAVGDPRIAAKAAWEMPGDARTGARVGTAAPLLLPAADDGAEAALGDSRLPPPAGAEADGDGLLALLLALELAAASTDAAAVEDPGAAGAGSAPAAGDDRLLCVNPSVRNVSKVASERGDGVMGACPAGVADSGSLGAAATAAAGAAAAAVAVDGALSAVAVDGLFAVPAVEATESPADVATVGVGASPTASSTAVLSTG